MESQQSEHDDHNQCGRGQYLPNCVQVVLCANVVINHENIEIIAKMETICL